MYNVSGAIPRRRQQRPIAPRSPVFGNRTSTPTAIAQRVSQVAPLPAPWASRSPRYASSDNPSKPFKINGLTPISTPRTNPSIPPARNELKTNQITPKNAPFSARNEPRNLGLATPSSPTKPPPTRPRTQPPSPATSKAANPTPSPNAPISRFYPDTLLHFRRLPLNL